MSSETRRRCAGISLIELVVFIVVVAIGIGGVVATYSQYTKSSVDPIVRKQALAVAESLLEEVALQPFTYCDPTDPAVYTATSATAAQCPILPEASGPEAGQARTGANPFKTSTTTTGLRWRGPQWRTLPGQPFRRSRLTAHQ